MTDASPKKIALDPSSYVAGDTAVEVPHKGGKLTLYVRELGYTAIQSIYARGKNADGTAKEDYNPSEHLIVASVHDGNGGHFTIEEARNLKREVAEPLVLQIFKTLKMQGVLEDNGDGETPKP